MSIRSMRLAPVRQDPCRQTDNPRTSLTLCSATKIRLSPEFQLWVSTLRGGMSRKTVTRAGGDYLNTDWIKSFWRYRFVRSWQRHDHTLTEFDTSIEWTFFTNLSSILNCVWLIVPLWAGKALGFNNAFYNLCCVGCFIECGALCGCSPNHSCVVSQDVLH
jgi:hypothetical protein